MTGRSFVPSPHGRDPIWPDGGTRFYLRRSTAPALVEEAEVRGVVLAQRGPTNRALPTGRIAPHPALLRRRRPPDGSFRRPPHARGVSARRTGRTTATCPRLDLGRMVPAARFETRRRATPPPAARARRRGCGPPGLPHGRSGRSPPRPPRSRTRSQTASGWPDAPVPGDPIRADGRPC